VGARGACAYSAPIRLLDFLLAPAALRSEGLTFAAIAAELERREVPTVRGGFRWFPARVRSVLRTRKAELAAQRD